MAQRKSLNGKEVLALLLYLPGKTERLCEPIVGRTRLVKTMFLFTKEIKPQLTKKGWDLTLPVFTPYDYGPFSIDVLNDVETLHALGIVDVDAIPESEPFDVLDDMNAMELTYYQGIAGTVERQFMDRYQLTTTGAAFCQSELKPRFTDARQWLALSEFKKRCNSISLTALLRYVYTRYPNYTANSKIRDQVLKYETLS